MTTEGEPGQVPPVKRVKTDKPYSEAADKVVKLRNIPACNLPASDDWCPKTFGAMLEDPSTHDVTFKTSDGGSVSAHRVIVAAGSPVFHAMLYGNMKESSQKEIELSTVNSKTLSTLLTFVYTGTVNIDPQCVQEVLEAAHYFNIALLEDRLIKFITDSLDMTNIVDVILFARNSNFLRLFKNCLWFMYHNADSVARDVSFTRLPSDIVLTFCKSSHLEIKEVVLFVAMFWRYKHQDLVPESALQKIFQEIRYPLISEFDLVNIVRPLKMADPALYTAALEYHLVPDRYSGPPSQITTRRQAPQNIKYINVNQQYMNVSDNSNGIVITKMEGFLKWNGLCAILVHPTQGQPVHFKIVLRKVATFSSCIYLVTRSFDVCTRHPRFNVDDVTGGIEIPDLCRQQEIEGVIAIRGNYIITTINGATITISKASVTYFCIHMKYESDELQFSFT